MPRRGLPDSIAMRHDEHYVEALAASAGTPIGRLSPIDQIDPNPDQPRQVMGDLSELIASIAGKEGNPNAVAYSASKAGVIALTKSLGKELAQTGVLVNCVTPAAAKTAIFDQMTEEHINYMLSKIPMNRFVTVDEIAALVCWLASEDCSFSTGAVFDISGGRATY